MGLDVPLQCLLQTFLSQNALTEVNLRAVIAELVYEGDRNRVSPAVIAETVTTINEDITEFDYEIRRTTEQFEGKSIWVLCNTTPDQLTQLATQHTQTEISYFKALLNYIFINNNTLRAEILAVAKMDAVREASAVGLTKAQGEQILRQFVEESWLHQSSQGFYSLTARTLMELQGYLQETYNDGEDKALKTCEVCKDFLTMGYRCPELSCDCRLHYKCFEGLYANGLKCPLCGQVEWNKANLYHVGERAAIRMSREEYDSDEFAREQLFGASQTE